MPALWLVDVATYGMALASVSAAFYLLAVRKRPRSIGWFAAWGVVSLFTALLLGSLWRETVSPLVRQGEWEQAGRAAAGFLIILVGVGAVLHGGFYILKGTVRAFNDDAL